MRHALRSLLRQPLFTVAAIAALGLGIGANTTIFTLANAMLFRPMPGIAQPERLVWMTSTGLDARPQGLSFLEYLDYREASGEIFSDLFAFQPAALSVGSGEPRRARGHLVTGTYFSALGVQARLGRVIAESDDRAGAPPVAVISHRLWREQFAESIDALGQTLIVNGRPFAIVGVAEEPFVGPVLGEAAEIWVPLAQLSWIRPSASDVLNSRDDRFLTVMARRRPDASLDRAQAAVAAIARRLELAYPESNRQRRAVVSDASGLPPGTRSEAISLGALLLVVSGIVLMIACANVANLLLARGAARSLELSIRTAVGATRLRLLQQLLTESVLLALGGVGTGLLIAFWTTDLLVFQLPEQEFRGLRAEIDGRVVAFTSLVGLASVAMAGLLPALSATRGALIPRLRETVAAGSRTRLQGVFVVAQLSLSLVLLLAGGLSLRALQKAGSVDLGFASEGIVLASYDLELQNYSGERRRAFRRELRERLRQVPGVASVGIANMAPLSGTMVRQVVATTAPVDRREVPTFINGVSPGFFRALSIPLLRGREFNDGDRASSAGVVVVNETLARRLWDDRDPIGQRIVLNGAALDVVGLARDAKYDESTEQPQPFLYTSLDQYAQLPRETLIVAKTAGTARAADSIRETLRQLDPALPVFDQLTMTDALRVRSDRERGVSTVLGAFGGLALLLASLGLYGVMSFAVTRRTREIGVRIALGASAGQLVSLVARDALTLTVGGLLIGGVVSVPLLYALGTLLFGVTMADVTAVAGICVVLVVVAMAAAAVPMRRASRLDAVVALRTE